MPWSNAPPAPPAGSPGSKSSSSSPTAPSSRPTPNPPGSPATAPSPPTGPAPSSTHSRRPIRRPAATAPIPGTPAAPTAVGAGTDQHGGDHGRPRLQGLAPPPLHPPAHRRAHRDGLPRPDLPARTAPPHPDPRRHLPHPLLRRPHPPPGPHHPLAPRRPNHHRPTAPASAKPATTPKKPPAGPPSHAQDHGTPSNSPPPPATPTTPPPHPCRERRCQEQLPIAICPRGIRFPEWLLWTRVRSERIGRGPRTDASSGTGRRPSRAANGLRLRWHRPMNGAVQAAKLGTAKKSAAVESSTRRRHVIQYAIAWKLAGPQDNRAGSVLGLKEGRVASYAVISGSCCSVSPMSSRPSRRRHRV